MHNISLAIKPAFLEILAIASFVAALITFDATLTNNDMFVVCLFFGMCLFGLAGLFTETADKKSYLISTLFGAIGTGAFVTGICLGLAGFDAALFAMALGIVTLMSSVVFRMACVSR